jgi:hypothetical protein
MVASIVTSSPGRAATITALLCGAGYNLRLILNYLRRLLRALLQALADQPAAAQAPA